MGVLEILRRSKPSMSDAGGLEERVMNSITDKQFKRDKPFNFFDFVFGWVYIKWVRTSLITVSVLLIAVFVYQQTIILKRINNLDSRVSFLCLDRIEPFSDSTDLSKYQHVKGRLVEFVKYDSKFAPLAWQGHMTKAIRTIHRNLFIVSP